MTSDATLSPRGSAERAGIMPAAHPKGSSHLPPSAEEADAFAAKVNKVSRLVDGLSKGTLSPEYVDKQMEHQTVGNSGQVTPSRSIDVFFVCRAQMTPAIALG